MQIDLKSNTNEVNVNRYSVMHAVSQFRDVALIQQALELGVFMTLREERSCVDIAELRGWSVPNTKLFLDALVALNMLSKKTKNTYVNSPIASESLDPSGSRYVGDMILHERLQQPLWMDLGRVFSASRPLSEQQNRALSENKVRNNVLLRAMQQISEDTARCVSAISQWDECKEILDVGGGHGLYMAMLARSYPRVIGKVLDLPLSRDVAEETIKEFCVEERVHFEECDLALEDPLCRFSADGILICRVLHNFSADAVRNILRSAYDVLPIGGLLVIVQMVFEEDRPWPAASALFGAYMSVNSSGGHLATRQWLKRELEGLGFRVQEEMLSEVDMALISTKQR